MPTNFELERLKPKLDIFKIPENRVHELTDSNVSLLSSDRSRTNERGDASARGEYHEAREGGTSRRTIDQSQKIQNPDS